METFLKLILGSYLEILYHTVSLHQNSSRISFSIIFLLIHKLDSIKLDFDYEIDFIKPKHFLTMSKHKKYNQEKLLKSITNVTLKM